VSSEDPTVGKIDPNHVGPPDLIIQEIVQPSEAPEDIRNRVAQSIQALADRDEQWEGITWANVTFAARALALVEGTDKPDCDDDGDPLVWVFGLSAESPIPGETIVSIGGFASSSSQIRYSKNQPARRGNRVSFFSAIRTEPRDT
jgi:hypothetical protein